MFGDLNDCYGRALQQELVEAGNRYAEMIQPAWERECMNTKVDMVEVVRCKDCIHYRYYGLTEDTVSECRINHCENPDKEWFCADGKRRISDRKAVKWK